MNAKKVSKQYYTSINYYRCCVYSNGVEVKNSYKKLFSWRTICELHERYPFKRTRCGMALEWAIHTICYRLNIQRDRAKDVFFEYGIEWFKNLFG